MSEKTMRKWFKTFLMMLPFLFLAIFAIGTRKDGLKYEIPNSDEGFNIIGTKSQADENGFINIAENLNEDGYLYLYYDASDIASRVVYDNYIILGTFTDHYNIELRIAMDSNALEFYDYNYGWVSSIPQSLEEYADEIYVDEILYSTIGGFINWGTDNVGQMNQVCITIYFNYAPTPSVADNDLQLYIENADIMPYIIEEETKEVKYITGAKAAFLTFNDMTEEILGENFFGMSDFYDWMNENWFDSEAPLIIKPVFKLLVYEALIELLFLLFSFITFIIRFAQKYIDGFYMKGGKQ